MTEVRSAPQPKRGRDAGGSPAECRGKNRATAAGRGRSPDSEIPDAPAADSTDASRVHRCVSQYAAAIGACRNETDAACETALKGEEGQLATVVADSEEPVRRNCTADAANKLTFLLGVDELNDAFFKVSAWRHTEYR
jgi:hypothetical protein